MRLSLVLAQLVALALAPAAVAESPKEGPMWVFIGTYTAGKKSEGIYRVSFDPATGKLGTPELAAKATNPSFLAIHPNRTHLFAVGEVGAAKGKRGGGVMSFKLDAKTGELTPINQQSSVGAGPCHITCDKEAKNVLVANYGGGSTTVLPIDKDGKLGEASDFVQHVGSSVNKKRQEAPHAHSVNLDAANRFAVVADLGVDKLFVFKYDAAKGKLTPNDPPAVDLAPGAGPRHFAFHPNGKWAYTNNELDWTITALSYDADKGAFTKLNTVSTLPAPHEGNSTAETVVHPNGKFVYVSNRGHNSIAIFEIDQSTGAVKAAGHQGSGVNVPRNFNIDPTGKWMVVANQAGDDLIVFAIDPQTGQLTPTGQSVKVGAPVCVKFVARG
jgi:6-phosphogluconolactonase